jgi:RNA polymerase primary sigma factor
LSSVLPDKKTPTPEDKLEEAYEREALQKFLDIIDKREAMVLKLRYGLVDGNPMTLEKIGKLMNLSRERVRQIEKETIKKLHFILTGEK